jgi:hypothetical protein
MRIGLKLLGINGLAHFAVRRVGHAQKGLLTAVTFQVIFRKRKKKILVDSNIGENLATLLL